VADVAQGPQMTEWEQVYSAFMEARPVILLAAAITLIPIVGDKF
jgi:hypothetical protein